MNTRNYDIDEDDLRRRVGKILPQFIHKLFIAPGSQSQYSLLRGGGDQGVIFHNLVI